MNTESKPLRAKKIEKRSGNNRESILHEYSLRSEMHLRVGG